MMSDSLSDLPSFSPSAFAHSLHKSIYAFTSSFTTTRLTSVGNSGTGLYLR